MNNLLSSDSSHPDPGATPDAVDEIRAGWHRLRPELDTSAVDVAGRLIRASALLVRATEERLAAFELTEADFAWITGEICALADRLCDGRIVSTLEGGYDLTALAASAAAHVSVLMERGK